MDRVFSFLLWPKREANNKKKNRNNKNEMKSFYSNFYKNDSSVRIDELSCSFLNSPKIPKLTNSMKNLCEGQLTVTECLNVLSSFN